MNRLFSNTLTLLIVSILCASCGSGAYVQYHKGPSDSMGYNFVIPRTVVKVEVVHQAAADKKGATGARTTSDSTKPATLSFTSVPVITKKGGGNLPILNVTDDSGKFGLVETSITNVTYADHLIIQSIGTQITDNRKAMIDAVFGAIGLVVKFAGFAEGEARIPCPISPDLDKLEPFILTDIHASNEVFRVPGNFCWGYQVTEQNEMGDMKISSFPLFKDEKEVDLALPTETKVPWFPYPACQNYNISVFPCDPNEEKSCKPLTGEKKYSAVVSVADGTLYRRIPLPPKGKVTMHTNFCVADVTSEASPLASDWDLMNQAINDVKNLNLKQSSTKK
jgi:hypothetical protein